MRVVVDTNVFINGIFKKDSFAKAIFNLKSLNKISFVMNKEMQNELLVTFGNILLEAIKRIDSKKDFNIFPLMATLSKCLWQVEEIDHIINTDYCKDDKSDEYLESKSSGKYSLSGQTVSSSNLQALKFSAIDKSEFVKSAP